MSVEPRAWLVAEATHVAHPLADTPVIAGRLERADLPLEGEGISRRHARVAPHQAGGYGVEDLGSRNGTRVNGELLEPRRARRLSEGDRIALGTHVLRYTERRPSGRAVRRHGTTELLALAGEPRGLEPRLKVVLRLGQALAGSPGIAEAAARLLGAAQEVLEADGAALHLVRSGVPGPQVVAAAGAQEDPAVVSEVIGEVLRGGDTLDLRVDARAILCAPVGHPPAGALWIARGTAFAADEVSLAGILGLFAGYALALTGDADEARRRADALEPPGPAPSRGEGPAAELARRVPLVAQALCPVLLLGETGTGKSTLARELHRRSPRARGPFVAVNCAAIPEALLEAELFGYGPRSGIANADPRGRAGRFELADGGTLFLDEIGDMPPAQQAKILTAIEERTVQRLGDPRPVTVDVRVVAATSRDLPQEIEAGRFRADLYHRLARAELELPPLRARLDELSALVDAALDRLRAEIPTPVAGLTPDALAALRAWPWPGNLRELENALAHALLACPAGGAIGVEHLPPRILAGGDDPLIRIVRDPASLTEMERARRDVLLAAIRETGSLTRAAARLGFSKQWAIQLARRYGVQVVQRGGGGA